VGETAWIALTVKLKFGGDIVVTKGKGRARKKGRHHYLYTG